MRQAVRDLLLSQSTMSLATTGKAGEPHAAAVYYANDEALNLFYFSDPASQHARDLARYPRAAAAIYPECQGWLDIRGLQLRGEVYSIEPGEDWEKGWKLYSEKFPFVKGLQLVVSLNRLYQFRPSWLRWTDNRRGFGHKEEWQRSGDNGSAWCKIEAADREHEISNGSTRS